MNTDQLLRLFVRKHRKIFGVVRENIEMWGELRDGPFNSDPLIEPRLDFLSEQPECSVVDSAEEGGKLHLWVFYSCEATIRCEEYKDRGSDEPLSTTGFSGGVTITIPAHVVADRDTGKIEEFEVDEDIAWEKWDNWPQQQSR